MDEAAIVARVRELKGRDPTPEELQKIRAKIGAPPPAPDLDPGAEVPLEPLPEPNVLERLAAQRDRAMDDLRGKVREKTPGIELPLVGNLKDAVAGLVPDPVMNQHVADTGTPEEIMALPTGPSGPELIMLGSLAKKASEGLAARAAAKEAQRRFFTQKVATDLAGNTARATGRAVPKARIDQWADDLYPAAPKMMQHGEAGGMTLLDKLKSGAAWTGGALGLHELVNYLRGK